MQIYNPRNHALPLQVHLAGMGTRHPENPVRRSHRQKLAIPDRYRLRSREVCVGGVNFAVIENRVRVGDHLRRQVELLSSRRGAGRPCHC